MKTLIYVGVTLVSFYVLLGVFQAFNIYLYNGENELVVILLLVIIGLLLRINGQLITNKNAINNSEIKADEENS